MAKKLIRPIRSEADHDAALNEILRHPSRRLDVTHNVIPPRTTASRTSVPSP